MKPETAPIRKAPKRPAPPTVFSLVARPEGSASSKAPNIEAASTSSTAAMPRANHPLPSTEPNTLPVRAATTPRVEKTSPMPTT